MACGLLLAVLAFAAPAAAQHQHPQHQPLPHGQATPNNDLWLSTAVGIEYAIDPQWSFHLDALLRIDRDISRLRDLEVRPGFEYAFSPHWAVAAGYVQFQRYQTPLRTQRGPFQDLLYRTHFGKVGFTGRLRGEELFYENGALLVRARTLAGVRIPIGDTPWEFAVSDEIFVDLKVDGTGRQGGFHHNRAYAGFGRQISENVKMSAGYQIDTVQQHGFFRSVHELKFGFAFRLN